MRWYDKIIIASLVFMGVMAGIILLILTIALLRAA